MTEATIGASCETLNLSDCISLKNLEVQSNTVSNISFPIALSGESEISRFYLVGAYSNDSKDSYDASVATPIGNIDVSSLTNLQYLKIGSRNLGDFDLGTLTGLTDLSLSNCKVDSLDISACSDLDHLYLSACKIDTLDISNCPKLCDAVNAGTYSDMIGLYHHYYSNNGSITYGKKTKLIYDNGVIIPPAEEPVVISIDNAKVVLSQTSFTYDGRIHTPTIKTIGGMALKKGTDYTITWSKANSWQPGTYTVTVTGTGNYTGKTKATYVIKKGANTLTAKGKTVKVRYSKLKKNNQTIKRASAITLSKAKGTVKYTLTGVTKAKFKKYFKVNGTNGKIIVRKGLKKGIYKLKVKVTATGTSDFNSASRTVTVKVKIY